MHAKLFVIHIFKIFVYTIYVYYTVVILKVLSNIIHPLSSLSITYFNIIIYFNYYLNNPVMHLIYNYCKLIITMNLNRCDEKGVMNIYI